MKIPDRKVLAVDPGEKRIGVAVSDDSGTIATPLLTFKHKQRLIDAKKIVELAIEHRVFLIIIGQSFYADGTPNPSGRKSARLAEVIKSITDIPVLLWDEDGSTQVARMSRKDLGIKRSRKNSHFDEIAATVILQSFLDSGQMNKTLDEDGEKDG